MSSPRFSVVIPTCRRPDTLRACLDRLAPGAQDLPPGDYEVIVTDDGVPTVEKLVSEAYPWAKWTQGPRKGPAANRNHGAAQASGAWIVFTDDDCIPSPGWLAAFAAALKPEVEVYEGRTVSDRPRRTPFEYAPENRDGGFLWSCNLILSRKAFSQLGGFDPGFPFPQLEDVDLRLRIEAATLAHKFVPQAEVLHPQRPFPRGFRRIRGHESYFYLALKHGRSVRDFEFRPRYVLRDYAREALMQQPWSSRLKFLAWAAVELGYLLVLPPLWWLRQRRRVKRNA